MKILHVADLHLRWFKWVRTHSRRFDLLVIAGDLQDAFSNRSSEKQAERCTEWLLTLSVPTMLCSGNHDIWCTPHNPATYGFRADWLRKLRGQGTILAADGDSVEFVGLNFTCVGWLQVPQWPRATDVVIAHAPPAACLCASENYGNRDLGDTDLRRAVTAHPTSLLVLSGHVHEPRRHFSRIGENNSLVLVPGCDPTAETPFHWEIDTTQGCAEWHGYPSDPPRKVSLFP